MHETQPQINPNIDLEEESISFNRQERQEKIDEYYRQIDKKVDELDQLYHFLQDKAKLGYEEFSLALATYYRDLIAKYPSDIVQKSERVLDLDMEINKIADKSLEELMEDDELWDLIDRDDSEEVSGDEAPSEEHYNLLQDHFVNYLHSLAQVTEAAKRKRQEVLNYQTSKDGQSDLLDLVSNLLNVTPEQLAVDGYRIDYDGLDVFFILKNPITHFLPGSGSAAFHVRETPVSVIGSSDGHTIEELKEHEMIHNYGELFINYNDTNLRPIEALTERIEFWLDNPEHPFSAPALEQERKLLNRRIDRFFRLCAEELVANHERLKREPFRHPARIYQYFIGRFNGYLDKNFLSNHPKVREALTARLDYYNEKAKSLSACIYELITHDKDSYVNGLFALFSPEKTKRWENVTERLVGKEEYRQTRANMPDYSLIFPEESIDDELIDRLVEILSSK